MRSPEGMPFMVLSELTAGTPVTCAELAADLPNLKAVFMEASFPDAMSDLARVSAHLTLKLFAAEAAKLPAGVQLIAVHIKPRYRVQTLAELAALKLPNLAIGTGGRVYEF